MTTLIGWADLKQQGYAPSEIRRMLRTGTLVRLHRGTYAWSHLSTEPAAHPENHRHLMLTQAVVRSATTPVVVGHTSAAVVHGLPVQRARLSHVNLIQPGRPGGGNRPGIRVTTASLTPADLTTVDALTVTSVARTIVDLGRDADPGWALAAADSALSDGMCALDEMHAALERAGGIPGVRAARRVIGVADERSESPGESLSRWLLVNAGLAPDDVQKEFPHPAGVDRVDFWWDVGVVGEFDGRGKYQSNARPGMTPEAVVWREKLREDRLRRRGLRVVRWTWDDLLRRPGAIVAWLRTALADASNRMGAPRPG